jgi:hypothetical protein
MDLVLLFRFCCREKEPADAVAPEIEVVVKEQLFTRKSFTPFGQWRQAVLK